MKEDVRDREARASFEHALEGLCNVAPASAKHASMLARRRKINFGPSACGSPHSDGLWVESFRTLFEGVIQFLGSAQFAVTHIVAGVKTVREGTEGLFQAK